MGCRDQFVMVYSCLCRDRIDWPAAVPGSSVDRQDGHQERKELAAGTLVTLLPLDLLAIASQLVSIRSQELVQLFLVRAFEQAGARREIDGEAASDRAVLVAL